MNCICLLGGAMDDPRSAAAAESHRVTMPFDMLPLLQEAAGQAFLSFTSEQPFAEAGVVPTCYMLGGGNNRMFVPREAIRDVWARSCENATGSRFWERAGVNPLLRVAGGALTVNLKSLFRGQHSYDDTARCRVCFDFDAENADDKPFPTPLQLYEVAVTAAVECFESDVPIIWSDERCLVFLGSNKTKERSAHVYFCDVHFVPDGNGLARKDNKWSRRINELLTPFGLRFDTAPYCSGLRWAFSDKRDKNSWRCAVNPLSLLHNIASPLSYRDLADLCDPACIPGDLAWQRGVVWKAASPVQKRRNAAGNRAVTTLTLAGPPNGEDAAMTRLIAHFPQLNGAEGGFRQLDGGVRKWTPRTTWCPFKKEPSDDQPAHQHGTPKLYAFFRSNGDVSVHCGVCTGDSVVIAADTPESIASCIDRLNRRYARYGEWALEYPTENRPMVLHKLSSFLHAEERVDEPAVKTNLGKMSAAKYWWHAPALHVKYRDIQCLPGTDAAPEGVYNSFTGFNQAVCEIADTLIDKTDAELEALFANTRNLILHNLCGGDEQQLMQFLYFMADMVAHPGVKPRVAIVVFGPQGCGKSLACEFFAELVGRKYKLLGDNTTLIAGYNSIITEKILLVCNEGISMDKRLREAQRSRIKGLITEAPITRREKYLPDKEVETFFRIIVTTNNDPDWIEVGDRRWIVLHAGFRLFSRTDPAWVDCYNAVKAERTSHMGCAAFMVWAKRRDFSQWRNDHVDMSKAHWQSQAFAMDPHVQFIYNILCRGNISGDITFGGTTTRTAFYELYKSSVSGTALHSTSFWRAILECSPLRVRRSESTTEWARDSTGRVRVPDLDAWRGSFAASVNMDLRIFNEWKVD